MTCGSHGRRSRSYTPRRSRPLCTRSASDVASSARIGEHEHPDRARLAVAHDTRARTARSRQPRCAGRSAIAASAARGCAPRNASVTWKLSGTASRVRCRLRPASELGRDRPSGTSSARKSLIRSSSPTVAARAHAEVCRLSNNRRTRWSAAAVARPRIISRSPGSSVRTATPRRPARRRGRTRGPRACRRCRPPGPATPVTATATSAPSRSRAPCGHRGRRPPPTPRRASRASSAGHAEVSPPSPRSRTRRRDPTKTSLAPGTAVRRAATMPPVHDSAVASVSPRARQRSRTISATERSSSVKRYGSSAEASEAATAAPRSTASGSDEQVDVDLELACADGDVHSVPFAAGGCERLGDGRLRSSEEAQHAVLARAARARGRAAPAPSRARAARASGALAAGRAAPRRHTVPCRGRAPARSRPARARSPPRAGSPACARRS